MKRRHGAAGQSPAGPAAPCRRFIPIHVHHRLMWSKRFQGSKATDGKPTTPLRYPISRMLGSRLRAPLPTRFIPEAALAITAIFDESAKLRIADRSARDAERSNLNGMSPFLVVEHKGAPGKRAKPEPPARNLHIALQRPGFFVICIG